MCVFQQLTALRNGDGLLPEMSVPLSGFFLPGHAAAFAAASPAAFPAAEQGNTWQQPERKWASFRHVNGVAVCFLVLPLSGLPDKCLPAAA